MSFVNEKIPEADLKRIDVNPIRCAYRLLPTLGDALFE